jgi:hypothetical protein
MKVPFYTQETTKIRLEGCTGLNKKNILLITTKAEIPDQLPFLKKVMRAVDIDFDEDLHFCISEDDLSVTALSDERVLAYDKLISFGFHASQLGIQDKDLPSSVVCYFERITCLIAPLLRDIAEEPRQKKQLWSALKEVFHT